MPFLRRKRLGISLEDLMLRRAWPMVLVVIGVRMLLGGFIITTAKNQSLFDSGSTPIGVLLILIGGFFLWQQFDDD